MDPAQCKAAIQDAFDNFMKVVAQQEDLLRQTLDHAKEESRKAEKERKYWEAQNHKAEEKVRDADTRLQVVEDILQEVTTQVKQLKAKESGPRPEIIPPTAAAPPQAQPVPPTHTEPQSMPRVDPVAYKPESMPPFRSFPGSEPDGPAPKSGPNFKAPPMALSEKDMPQGAKVTRKVPPPVTPSGPPGLQAVPKEEASRTEFASRGPLKAPPPPAPTQDNWFTNSNSGPEDGSYDRDMAKRGQPPPKVPPNMPFEGPPKAKAPGSTWSNYSYGDPKPSGGPPHKAPPGAPGAGKIKADPPDLPPGTF